MKKSFVFYFVAFMLMGSTVVGQTPSLYDLSCNHKINPMGISDHARLSWKIKSEARNVLQASYHVRAATSKDFSRQLLASKGLGQLGKGI
jgi:hypothetical protein